MGRRKCQTASSTLANTGICEVLTDDKAYFEVMADARLKLEKETSPTMPCSVTEDSRGTPHTCTTSIHVCEEQSDSENTGARGKVKRQPYGPHCRKKYVGSFHFVLVHKPVKIQEAVKIPEGKADVNKEWDH